MSALIVQAAEIPDPLSPDFSKVAVERRRRPLTALFGVLIASLVLTTGSSWPVTGGVREVFFVSGIMLACIGAFGRIWSNLFISGYKSKQLITTGPYSLCRNPLYFFSSIGIVGIGLATETLSIPLVFIGFFSVYYPMIIGREEHRLAYRHGEAFAEYCRQTPAFWPKWSLYSEPEIYVMQPRAMRKNLADAFWFIAIAAIVHAEAHLSQATGMPVIFNLF